ncbi:aldehyde dehydrogenase [Halalkalibacter kiskunsagensis]|uniref:Aldehyde dehydrogenase n=1 Tax=Halalkalibacter kiskunsagensis TaxID=1548599 RepID=A0ABV6KCX9_9BACI
MYERLVQKQRSYFYSGATRDISFRMKQLTLLKWALKKRETEIVEALRKDLNKSEEEAFLTELGPLYQEISHMKKHLPKWAKREKVKTALSHVGSKGHIHHEPHGVTLIIAPWNYPLQLAFAPLVGAIAGGNCAVLKPSELTPATSSVMSNLVKEYFTDEYIAVAEGAVEVSQALLAQRFDYIFFTGSVSVGKKVMEAASKNLTPHTLELGGKSPAIVNKDAKLDLAAKRIVWGKFINAGQTCVAPDYVFVHKEVEEAFYSHLKKHIKNLFDEKYEQLQYPKIVSERHFNRLLSFMNDGDVVVGGKSDNEKLTIYPTVLRNVKRDASIMNEEIFGPILPVLCFTEYDKVMERIREGANPLALYVFAENKEVQNQLIHGLPFGGGCINDTIMHLATPHLPFGGKGESGTGAYHGYESFATFTHKKSILTQSTLFDVPVRYKQDKKTMTILRKLLR